MLYVPLDFEINLVVGALVDSGAFVSSIAQDDLDTIKQKAPNTILKIDDPPQDHKTADDALTIPPTTTRTITAFVDIRQNGAQRAL